MSLKATKNNTEEILPLTPVQEGMLFHSISEPGSGVYVGQINAFLTGEFNKQIFIDVWQQVYAYLITGLPVVGYLQDSRSANAAVGKQQRLAKGLPVTADLYWQGKT